MYKDTVFGKLGVSAASGIVSRLALLASFVARWPAESAVALAKDAVLVDLHSPVFFNIGSPECSRVYTRVLVARNKKTPQGLCMCAKFRACLD